MTEAITSPHAAGLHYSVSPERGLRMYVGAREVFLAPKPYQMIDVAKDCLSGLLRIQIGEDPAVIVDHGWLLRLAADCCSVAAAALSDE